MPEIKYQKIQNILNEERYHLKEMRAGNAVSEKWTVEMQKGFVLGIEYIYSKLDWTY